MKRILLFSALTESNRKAILSELFPSDIQNKVFSYIPSGGVKGSEPYIEQWRLMAQEYGAQFNVIDNSVNDIKEQRKLLSSNIILISGGNTFNLLQNLRDSSLDKSIKAFIENPDFVLAGFSAGALVLTPTIKVCSLPDFDENLVGLQDLTGLSIVNFEVFPHYDKFLQKATLERYRETTPNHVYKMTDEGYLTFLL